MMAQAQERSSRAKQPAGGRPIVARRRIGAGGAALHAARRRRRAACRCVRRARRTRTPRSIAAPRSWCSSRADEARRAFERAATIDPDCALGYWGQAVSGLPPRDEALTDAALEAGAMPARRAGVGTGADADRARAGRLGRGAVHAWRRPRRSAYDSRVRKEPARARPGAPRRRRADDSLRPRGAAADDPARRRGAATRDPPPRRRVSRSRPSRRRRGGADRSQRRRALAGVAQRAADAIARVRLPVPHALALRAWSRPATGSGPRARGRRPCGTRVARRAITRLRSPWRRGRGMAGRDVSATRPARRSTRAGHAIPRCVRTGRCRHAIDEGMASRPDARGREHRARRAIEQAHGRHRCGTGRRRRRRLAVAIQRRLRGCVAWLAGRSGAPA